MAKSNATTSYKGLQDVHMAIETIIAKAYIHGKSRKSVLKLDVEELGLMFNSLFEQKGDANFDLKVTISVDWTEKTLS